MKYLTAFFTYVLFTTIVSGQTVSKDDSLYNAIAYWSKSDTLTYDVEFKKYKVKGVDTTVTFYTTYQMVLTVKDSTEKSYILSCAYTMDSVYNKHKIITEITKAKGDIRVDIYATEVGLIQGVRNWQEVSKHLIKTLDKFSESTKVKSNEIDKIIASYKDSYKTKNNIDNSVILDIYQMFYYHGLQYTLGESLDIDRMSESIFSGNKIKTTGYIKYDSLRVEEGVVEMHMYEELDPDQLKDDFVKYISKLTNKDKKGLDEINLESITYNTTYIDMYSGWVINSFETKEIKSGDDYDIQERSIRLR